MASRQFVQFVNTLHAAPVLIDCNFVVDSTNGNGLGIRNLKGPGVAAVYMNTSATPAAGNPNPAAGTIVVQLADNYNRVYPGWYSLLSPVSGTPILVTAAGAHLTVGVGYVIVTLGTTTAADWITLGVPKGVVPAVGVSFIAAATGAGVGSGAVEIAAATGTGINSIETLGDPNASSNPTPQAAQGFGAQIILQCRLDGTITAPTNNSVIGLGIYLGNSSLLLAGE
jgi:hypothetical protein